MSHGLEAAEDPYARQYAVNRRSNNRLLPRTAAGCTETRFDQAMDECAREENACAPKPPLEKMPPAVSLVTAPATAPATGLPNATTAKKRRTATAEDLTPEQQARLRLAIGPELNAMLRKGNGTFALSEDLARRLTNIGGDFKIWKQQFDIMAVGRTNAALAKLGSVIGVVGSDDFAKHIIESVSDPASIWARGEPLIATCLRTVLASDAGEQLVVYVRDLVQQYASLVDRGVGALARKSPKVAAKQVAPSTLTVLADWVGAISTMQSAAVEDWASFNFFDIYVKAGGKLDHGIVIGLVLGSFRVEIQEEVATKLAELRAVPLVAAQLPESVSFSQQEAETIYYIAGAVSRRCKNHFMRMMKGGNNSSGCVCALSYFERSQVDQTTANQQGLPTNLVLERQKQKLVFVNKKFFKTVVQVELTFSANCSPANLASHGEDLFSKLEAIALAQPILMQLVREGASTAPSLSDQMAVVSTVDDPPYLSTIAALIVRKFRKIRQADFLKAIFRRDKVETEALRRRLKGVCGSADAVTARALKRAAKQKSAQDNAATRALKKRKRTNDALREARTRINECLGADIQLSSVNWTLAILEAVVDWATDGKRATTRQANEAPSAYRNRLLEEADKHTSINAILAAVPGIDVASESDCSDRSDRSDSESDDGEGADPELPIPEADEDTEEDTDPDSEPEGSENDYS